MADPGISATMPVAVTGATPATGGVRAGTGNDFSRLVAAAHQEPTAPLPPVPVAISAAPTIDAPRATSDIPAATDRDDPDPDTGDEDGPIADPSPEMLLATLVGGWAPIDPVTGGVVDATAGRDCVGRETPNGPRVVRSPPGTAPMASPDLPSAMSPAPVTTGDADMRAALARILHGNAVVDDTMSGEAPAASASTSSAVMREAPLRSRVADETGATDTGSRVAAASGEPLAKATLATQSVGDARSDPPRPPRARSPRAIEAAAAAIPDAPAAAAVTAPATNGSPASSPPAIADQAFHHLVTGAHDGHFLDQLARDIARSGGPDAQLSFRLDPAHLGPMAVHIAQDADGASIRLSADHQHARTILADSQPRLAAEARAQGLTLREANVDAGGDPSGRRHDGRAPSATAGQAGGGGGGSGDGRQRSAWSSPNDKVSPLTLSHTRTAPDAAARYA